MTNSALIRLSITAALLFTPVAASAQNRSTTVASLANNVAATASVTDSEPKAVPAVAVEKKICKQLPSSYSRMTTRTCLTASQWKQVEEQSQY